MAGQTNNSGGMLSEINVTPFVDIVLVLLVVLMVSSIQIVKASMQVELPKAASAGETVDSTLNIVILLDGDKLLDGQPTTDAAIAAKVRSEKAKNPKVQAVIAADKGVVYDSVISTIDLVKTNGVTSFALNIERAAKK
jgi:biopolymer transport protein ExbD